MYGLLFDCLEKYVVLRYGRPMWLTLVKKADIGIGQSQWVTIENYPDESFFKLLALLAFDVVEPLNEFLEGLGYYFVEYLSQKGYDELLRCQGHSLREWIARVNELHMHLKIADEQHKELTFPEIYCLADSGEEGQESSSSSSSSSNATDTQYHGDRKKAVDNCSLTGDENDNMNFRPRQDKNSSVDNLLYYKSKRGATLAALLVGMVRAAAVRYFGLSDITFTQIQSQGVHDSEFTVWRMKLGTSSSPAVRTTSLADDEIKLSSSCVRSVVHNTPAAAGSSPVSGRGDHLSSSSSSAQECHHHPPRQQQQLMVCPFSGRKLPRSPSSEPPIMANISSNGVTVPASSPSSSSCCQPGAEYHNKNTIAAIHPPPYDCHQESDHDDTNKDGMLTSTRRAVHDLLEERDQPVAAAGEPYRRVDLHDSEEMKEKAAEDKSLKHNCPPIGLSGAQMVDVFPYHIGLNKDFVITQVGSKLRTCFPSDIVGTRIAELFRITEPVECPWDWRKVELCRDSTFELELIDKQREGAFSYRLYGGLLLTSQHHPGGLVGSSRNNNGGGRSSGGGSVHGFLLLKPFVQSVKEMSDNNLTWSDFGRYSSQQRLILLAEHLKAETAHALKSQQEAILTQQSLEMKRMFVRYVSHEIRTPLNTVSMGLDLIQSLRPSPAAEDDALGIFSMADEIKESCNIAIGILNDLLLYEKLEGGILTLSKKCEPALAVVHEAVRPFTIQAKAVNVDLELSLDSSVFGSDELTSPTVFIDVDKAKMSQVVRNLVSNAIKFSASSASGVTELKDRIGGDEKEVNIEESDRDSQVIAGMKKVYIYVSTIKGDRIIENGKVLSTSTKSRRSSMCAEVIKTQSPKSIPSKCHFLRVEVIDQGPGISEPNQLMLFNQIVQFDPNKLQGGNGSGLGLYISKGIMDLHDGSIGVFSEGEGLGSCFWVDIPLHKADEPCSCSPANKPSSFALSNEDVKNSSTADEVGVYNSAARFLDEWRDHSRSVALASLLGTPQPHGASISGTLSATAARTCNTPHPKLSKKDLNNAPKVIVPLNIRALSAAADVDIANSSSASSSSKAAGVEPIFQQPPQPRRQSVSSSTPSSLISHGTHNLSASGTVTRRASVRNAHVHPLPGVFIDAVPKHRVLVVDDSMANRKMTSRFLQMSKIAEAITEAEDGLQAVAAVKKSMEPGEKEFNVILMDYVMPEVDGPTATKAIRALGYKGLLVGVTGNLLPEDTELFMSSGATAVMGKPLDMKELKYLLMKSIVASNPSVRSSFSHISSPSACHTPGKGLVPRGTKANHPNRANKDGIAGFGYANEQHSSFCFYQSDDSFLAPVVSRGQSFRGFGAAPQSIQSSFHMGEKSLLMPAMHLSQDLPKAEGNSFRCMFCGERNVLPNNLNSGNKCCAPPNSMKSSEFPSTCASSPRPHPHDIDEERGFRSPTAVATINGVFTPQGTLLDELKHMSRSTPQYAAGRNFDGAPDTFSANQTPLAFIHNNHHHLRKYDHSKKNMQRALAANAVGEEVIGTAGDVDAASGKLQCAAAAPENNKKKTRHFAPRRSSEGSAPQPRHFFLFLSSPPKLEFAMSLFNRLRRQPQHSRINPTAAGGVDTFAPSGAGGTVTAPAAMRATSQHHYDSLDRRVTVSHWPWRSTRVLELRGSSAQSSRRPSAAAAAATDRRKSLFGLFG